MKLPCGCLVAAWLCAQLAAAADIWQLHPESPPPLATEVISSETKDGIKIDEIRFTSEIAEGKPVRVYGFMARPVQGKIQGKLPGVLQLHGGGGTASKSNAEQFARSAQAVVLNIDWSSDPSRAKLVTLAPFADAKLFGDPRYVTPDLGDFSAKHAARALSRAIDLLERQPEVDPGKIAVFGGSWGGFLSFLIAGLDPRVRCISSGYGVGAFRDTYSFCSRVVYNEGEKQAGFWLDNVDPIQRMSTIRARVSLLAASNDLHFWLGSVIQTAREMPPGSRLILSPNTVHTTGSGIKWPSADWLESCFGEGPDWPAIESFHFDGRKAEWGVASKLAVTRSELYFSPGREHWPGRVWLRVPATAEASGWGAVLPEWLAGVEGDAYPLVTDDRGRSVSAIPVHRSGLSLSQMSMRRKDPGLIDDFADGIGLWRLLLDNATKAKLSLADGGQPALVVTEARGQREEIAVETNAITLASGMVSSGNFLEFSVDSGGEATELNLELFESPGEKAERILRVAVPVKPASGFQPVKIPLSDFGLSGPVSKLNLRWTTSPGHSWKFAAFRIASSSASPRLPR